MKRTTVVLPDHLAALLDQERRRRDVSAAMIIREAVESYLVNAPAIRRLRIANLGASGHADTSERVEEILDEEWGSAEGYRALVLGEPAGSGEKRDDSYEDADQENPMVRRSA